jgi:hypothetical protein
MLHADAILSEEDREMLCDWADLQAMKLMRSK